MSEIQPELTTRLFALARAIDDVLIASHGPRARLKSPPPFDAPLSDGVARYGPGPVFELWAQCRAIEALRVAWTGKPGAVVGMAVDAPTPADDGADKQQRLGGR
jgi:hypothetical protein